jgi:hypothetical protein
MAEKQLVHRLELESTALSAEIKRADRGQIFALVLSLVVIGVCFVLIMTGHPVLGLSGILLNLAGLAGVFVYATWDRNRQLAERAKLPGSGPSNGGNGS